MDLRTPDGVRVRARQLWKDGPTAYSWCVLRIVDDRVTLLRIPRSYSGIGQPRSVTNTVHVEHMRKHEGWGWRLVGTI